jgi:D-alanine-D-alanine ligase-like ATP-grasp enzyme
MKRTCEAAAALFPNSLYCGIDLLIRPDYQQHAILEINAFGDLLPGTTWNGFDTYTSEVQAMLKKVKVQRQKTKERQNFTFDAGVMQP